MTWLRNFGYGFVSWLKTIGLNFKEAREGRKYSYLFTIIIGLGFFTTAITWSIYNIYIPTYLDDYLSANWGDLPFASTIIGFIMVLDNIIAVLLQPWIGNISDNTWARYSLRKRGRRMPFVLVGIPLGAVFFAMLGLVGYDSFHGAALTGFILLLVAIGGFNISMALYRSPVVALMPDLVPKQYRSRANGMINLLGGIGALMGLFALPIIYRINPSLAFIIVSIINILCLVILFFSIKEPQELKDIEKKEKIKIIPAIKEIFAQEDKSMLFILLAIFSWFFGYNIIETYFSLYGTKILLIPKEDASMILGVLALTFILFALPAGILSKKIGRKISILIGLILIVLSLSVAAIVSVLNAPVLMSQISFLGMDVPYAALIDALCFLFAGIGWALVNINSIVIVWHLVGKEKVGMGTGIYYFFSASAAIVGPLSIGGIFDLIKFAFNLTSGEQYRYLFFFSTIFFVIAGVFMFFVKTTGKESDKLEPEI
ncbi:MAG: MFS transporter [Candidatus Heimdallarchaeaceae archaeon]